MYDNVNRSETSIADFMNISEAAEYLGVSTSTLRNWDHSGTFKALRHPINNYRLYRKNDLASLLEQLRSAEAAVVPEGGNS
jgi:MerR family transcriptional regulator, copper efflux regulator